MHIGGAAQGLQHVVYDPKVVVVPPTRPQPAPVASSEATTAQDEGDRQERSDRGTLYNPVVDLIERLNQSLRPLITATGHHGGYEGAGTSEPHLDVEV